VTWYPVISDRVMRTVDYECHLLPDENPVFVVAMAFLGDHLPGTIIVVSYAVVYYEIRKLIKTRPQTAGILSLMYVLTSERRLNLALLTLSSFKLHIKTRPRYLNTNGFKSSSLAVWDPDGSAFSLKPQILALLL